MGYSMSGNRVKSGVGSNHFSSAFGCRISFKNGLYILNQHFSDLWQHLKECIFQPCSPAVYTIFVVVEKSSQFLFTNPELLLNVFSSRKPVERKFRKQ